MGEQVTEVEQEVIVMDNSPLFHFSGLNNDLPVLKQWKGALITLLKIENLELRAR